MKRTLREFKADNLTDLSAALTYYGVLAIFPLLIVLVSILGLIGHSVTQPLIENLGKVAPGPARQIFTSASRHPIQQGFGRDSVRRRARRRAVVGLELRRGLYAGVEHHLGRGGGQADLEDPPRSELGVTLVTVVLLTLSAVAVVLTGALAEQVGNLIGVGQLAVTIWDIAKWPVLLLIVALMLAILYYAAPNVRQPGFRWVTPGGVLAVLLWVLASAAFAFYVANFSSYNKTYGALASVIVFLVWLWITNTVILLGAELNAEIERGRQIEGGHPPEREPFLPTRSNPENT